MVFETDAWREVAADVLKMFTVSGTPMADERQCRP